MTASSVISKQLGRAPTAADLAFVQDRRVGRLATADETGTPTVVPICYSVVSMEDEPVVVTALDEKPKRVSVRELTRVRHILARPEVTLVVDDYSENWNRLAFVQLHGRAGLIEPGEPGFEGAVRALRTKYPQYERMVIDEQPVIAIRNLTANSWRGGAWGEASPAARPGEVELASLLRGRRSVRSFQRRPVPREEVEQAIAAAGWAPSPHGRQPWRFAVVEAEERRVALAEAMADTWRAQLELDGQDPEIVQIRLDKSRQRLHDAPVLIVACLYLAGLDQYPDAERQDAERIMAIQSLGAAVQNLLLAVYAAGLDAGWMCAPLFCPDLVRDQLGLDQTMIPHALIPVGYPAKDPVRRERLALDQLIVNWA